MILSYMRNKLSRFFFKSQPPKYIRQLADLNSQLVNFEKKCSKSKSRKILYGPSFSIYPPCFIHDRLLSSALRLKGAEIIPIYCDGVFCQECSYYGGVWLNGETFATRCEGCRKSSEDLWRIDGVQPLQFSKYINAADLSLVDAQIKAINSDDWPTYFYNGMPFGKWAKEKILNHYLVGNLSHVPDSDKLGLLHIRNIFILEIVYTRILETVAPDIVVSHDSFYYMPAVLQYLCESKNIPFYSHWSGTSKGAWCYAFNDSAMNLNFTKSWEHFSSKPLDGRKKTKVEDWLKGRVSGEDMILDTASMQDYKSEIPDLDTLNPEKPTALLTSNVVWDLAALSKQIVFSDMMEWIAETIEWFGRHPEYQLIVKPHPGEQHPKIPETTERVGSALALMGVDIPENVKLLKPTAKITLYDLIPRIDLGLVYTTTSAIEIAAKGVPVITTAKSPYRGFGFTIDPDDKKQYFESIINVFNRVEDIDFEKQKDLSYKFILFYFYHYFTKINLIEFKWGDVPVVNVSSIEDILPGKNKYLDYITGCIMNGDPVLTEDNYPPESH